MPKCRICKCEYARVRPLQPVCASFDCKVEYGVIQAEKSRQKREKAERQEVRKRKQALKTRRDYLNEAQVLVNRYVRLRDASYGCISCDKDASWNGQWHASHYKSTGANSALRFNLWNIHKACSICNNHKSGNLAEYRPRLVKKIGIEKVEILDSHERSRIYSIDELKKYISVFKKMCKRMEERNAD